MALSNLPIVRLGGIVIAVALSACSDKTVREPGAELVSKKIDIVAGVGDQLQAKGGEAGESLTAGVGKVVHGIQRGALKSGRSVALDTSVAQAGLEISQVAEANAQAGQAHALQAYVIASAGAGGKLQLFAYDALDREIGRATANVALAAGEAQYVPFPLATQVTLGAIARVRLTYAPKAASAR